MDRYDAAIAYLTRNPNQIQRAWEDPKITRGGSLFLWCSCSHEHADGYGCLTQVHSGQCRSGSSELTEKILEDKRLVGHPIEVKIRHLRVFAEYQREMDLLWPGRFPDTKDDQEAEKLNRQHGSI